ncbi:LamG-like jellyroll fold domain-containing protein, partial [Psychroserpens luteolus]|uniref:LamG-like jellyroll fold domain-containing protein n=1 Tax=Psychroserpens luteolus TaxID=2855840 RepID=UPI001E61D75F
LTYNTQGTFVINWTFDDGNGNVIVVPQNVIVDDVTDPTIPTLADVTGECSATATAPTTSDNCSGTLTGTTSDALTYNTQGTFVINWTFDDGNGNVIVVPQNVIVDDVTDPTIPTLADVTGECSATATAPTTSDNCSGTLTGTTSDALTYNTQGTFVINWTFDDGNGNVIVVPQNVIVDDVSGPAVPNLPTITEQCSATVSVPTTTDGCSGTITGTTSDPLTYNTQGSFAITWNFDDGNGNAINVVQNVVINDTTDPVPVCQDLTIQLDNTNGTASITGAQIDNGSTDNCGTVNFSLSQSSFDCTDIGTNVIVLTVDDGNGNSAICTSTVTVVSPTISGGTVLGYLNNTETVADADNLVEVTACPDEPQNATFNLSGHTGNVVYWQASTNGGLIWTNIANTTTSYYFADILETTLIRAVVQIGSCQATSSIVRVVVIPPDIPPTIIGPDTFDTCLGASITVEAQSSFATNPELNDGGEFNQANLPGWLVDGNDGVSGWSASGSNTSPTPWRGISNGNANNSSNITEGVRYKNQGGGKFAITYGDFGAPNITTLETAVFNTLGLSSASIDFQSAYYLQAGAMGIVELSVDGGTTYPVTLMSFSGPGDSGGFVNLGGGANNVPTIDLQDAGNSVSLDLTNYIGLTNLRVRFTFTSTVGSSWAIDGITIPQAPVDEVIEWEDGTGTVVTVGAMTTITPVTPGIQTYGVTSLINGCRAVGNEGTEFIDVNATLAYAGEDLTQLVGECGEDVTLNAYDNNLTAAQNIVNGVSNPAVFTTGTYPGTGEAGVWSATQISACGGNYSFSDIGSPTSKFSADPGTYQLTWTVPTIGCSDTVEVVIQSCPTIDFDGADDYVTFKDNYNLSNQFSIETWVKPESVVGTQTLFSKRDANNLATGYDLRLVGTTVQFNWNAAGTIQSAHPISTNRWYHIAVTNNNGSYRLYIDGIEVSAPVAGSAPSSNNMNSFAGAMDQANNAPNRPVNYFNGWMDELRIWNTALTTAQIRQMMNQEIQDNTAVRGVAVPLDIAGLSWADLDGYYRMDVNCGTLVANKGIRGLLRNMTSAQQETAPLPYTSRVDGQDWATDNTWTNFNVWDAPNSIGVDGATPIDWNIVQTSHDINSGNKDIIVLGLISDTPNKVLDIKDPGSAQDETNDGQSLRITHYLKLDGDIDLFGESQLLQDEGSVLDVTSAGRLERDQQGTANLYNYNYWGSPVSIVNTSSNNTPFNVNAVLRDGTNSNNPQSLQWIGTHDANGTTSPITMSSYWLFAYENYPFDSYASWRSLSQTDNIATGLSFTMKGSGAGNPVSDVQNYVFIGKPNNGTITTPITIGNQALIGNPYPSAIDANAFILDNIPGGNPGTSQSTDGTLYFWEHYTSNFTHILEDYEGGYATYNLTGGNPAVSPPLVSGNGTPTKLPGRYVPISQGFFVTASNVGGNIQFKNSQRVFEKETTVDSEFLRTSNPNLYRTQQQDPNPDVQRVRLDFTTVEGAVRHLLLGFIPNGGATDGVDYAYDAENSDTVFPNDMFWRIEGGDYTTQGVGDFDDSKQYPLVVYVNMPGSYEVSLNDLENFEEAISVYIYDALLDTYTEINNNTFQIALDAGTYVDRFYVAFSAEALSIPEEDLNQQLITYFNSTQEIFVKTTSLSEVKKVKLINLLGQEVQSWDNVSDFVLDDAIRIPAKRISEGTYIIKVYTTDNTYNNKVIVKK